MAGLDASCSTMFVAGNDGLYYSRFCDYDTLGNNIWFEYNKVSLTLFLLSENFFIL